MLSQLLSSTHLDILTFMVHLSLYLSLFLNLYMDLSFIKSSELRFFFRCYYFYLVTVYIISPFKKWFGFKILLSYPDQKEFWLKTVYCILFIFSCPLFLWFIHGPVSFCFQLCLTFPSCSFVCLYLLSILFHNFHSSHYYSIFHYLPFLYLLSPFLFMVGV